MKSNWNYPTTVWVGKDRVKDLGETSELLKTHPNSSKRVIEVIKNSKEKIPFNPITGSEVFLKKIDGMIYGEKPEEGFFVKNTFIHKKLDFSFSFSNVSFFFICYRRFCSFCCYCWSFTFSWFRCFLLSWY